MGEIVTWNGWKCIRKLGSGSFGRVYEIAREEFGKTYRAALKVITIPQNEAEIQTAYSDGMDEKSVTSYFYSYVENISKEISLMSDLKGFTNIVSYEDHQVIPHEDGVGWDIYIRMELLTPLMEYVKIHPMTEEDVLKLGCDICNALILCRQKNIIHRDIKPQNIFVNDNGDFKLGDFGIARTIEKTVSGLSVKGTYDYMAPEVYQGKPYGYTADIYSTALVLYKYLNENRNPFWPVEGAIKLEDKTNALDRRIAGEPIPDPLHGSNKLKNVIAKALCYDPEKRYQTAREFLDDLKKCRNDENINIEEDRTEKTVFVNPNLNFPEKEITPEKNEKKKKHKHKKVIFTVAIIALAIAGIAGMSVIGKNKAQLNEISKTETEKNLDEQVTNKKIVKGAVAIDIPEVFSAVESTESSELYQADNSSIILNIQSDDTRTKMKQTIESATSDNILMSYKETFRQNHNDWNVEMVYYSDKDILDCPGRVAQAKVTDEDGETVMRIFQMIVLTDRMYTWTFYDMDGKYTDIFTNCIQSVRIVEAE